MTHVIKACAMTFLGAAPFIASAQLMSDDSIKAHMKEDVVYLTSDELDGRETGTEGERLAAAYIIERYKQIGLTPKGDDGSYLQEFGFEGTPELVIPRNNLQLGRTRLTVEKDYYPISFSANGSVLGKVTNCIYGIVSPEKDYNDLAGREIEGRVAAISIGSPDGIHPHSDYLAYHDLQQRVDLLAEKGATAVILYNDDETVQNPPMQLSAWVKASAIPVVFLKGDIYEQLLLDNNPVALAVTVNRPQNKGQNVIGYMDNGAAHTVIIGAHYDHSGVVGFEAHKRTDDNASGIAIVLQLATDLKELPLRSTSNYLFIAFSGQEKGLLGSNYFVRNPTVDLATCNYMFNFDMVGRLDSSKTIGINGVGTSPAWKEIEQITAGTLHVKTTGLSIEPSDHSSFSRAGIPAIHFSSNAHKGHHKPNNNKHPINYDGMVQITRFAETLIESLSDKGKLLFTKTDDVEPLDHPVTLGIIPDHLYEGQGMRIDALKAGKPAANAGLLKGDIVLKLGGHEVRDLTSYLKALRTLKGNSTIVTVKRAGKEIRSDIQF